MAKTIIIAEAGVNHNGDITLAKSLVDVAVAAGVDYVKFQTFKAEALVAKQAKKADYQIVNTQNEHETQLEMLKKLELSEQDHQSLIQYCKQKGIHFFSTAFDLGSLQYLADIGLDLVKIPSGELTNLPYLRKAAHLFKKVILSTGMATLAEIKAAIAVFLKEGIPLKDIIVLHCTTEYPTPMQEVNLKAMQTIAQEFDVQVGYSDHTTGIEIPIAAVALGACVIEKHFTLDKNMEGPDHKASLNPEELGAMVKAIRNIELALSGNGIKEPTASELKNIAIARKSITAKKPIKAGTPLTEDNITTKRPGTGLSPMLWDSIMGTIATQDFNEDDLIV
ncbi:N-acetylneuraminate synthase [Pedobacter aquae]|uniref:N-acetylneuraminate synthase n=1 Tax=Pedobacter aquae TaxID=2605747 RepID=A0A5C0VJG2_9SPHI|nr:N-acetylneuraminate synthase [Pedobacter aquae]QEK52219.1 N-acetylneuraminate synthase [Pedobacter aquae]